MVSSMDRAGLSVGMAGSAAVDVVSAVDREGTWRDYVRHGADSALCGFCGSRQATADDSVRCGGTIFDHALGGIGIRDGVWFAEGVGSWPDLGGLLPGRHGIECHLLSRARERGVERFVDHVLDVSSGGNDAAFDEMVGRAGDECECVGFVWFDD